MVETAEMAEIEEWECPLDDILWEDILWDDILFVDILFKDILFKDILFEDISFDTLFEDILLDDILLEDNLFWDVSNSGDDDSDFLFSSSLDLMSAANARRLSRSQSIGDDWLEEDSSKNLLVGSFGEVLLK
jgi:hypothetical protein